MSRCCDDPLNPPITLRAGRTLWTLKRIECVGAGIHHPFHLQHARLGQPVSDVNHRPLPYETLLMHMHRLSEHQQIRRNRVLAPHPLGGRAACG